MTEALSDYLNASSNQDTELDNDGDADVDSNPDVPATVDPTSTGNSESRGIDEDTFFNELLVLREMLAPLLDESKPIYWITNRSHQPQDMCEDFEWSCCLMNTFVWKFGGNLWKCHGNCEITQCLIPFGLMSNLQHPRVYLQPFASR